MRSQNREKIMQKKIDGTNVLFVLVVYMEVPREYVSKCLRDQRNNQEYGHSSEGP
jgi:hypothetical protein